MDRETLKAFVTQAGEATFSNSRKSGDLSRYLESQGGFAGPERALETRFRVPLRSGL